MWQVPHSLEVTSFLHFTSCWRIYDVGMRRLILVAAFVFASGVVPALAQRGGHGGLPGRGGFGGHVSGAASHGGMRGGSSFHSPRFRSSGFPNRSFPNRGPRNLSFGRRGFSHDPFLRNRGFQRNRFDRFDHDRDDSRFRFGLRNCFGFNCGWGWGWPGWWDSSSSYDQNQEDDLERANQMNLQSLEEQRQRRQEDPDSNVRSDPQPQPREDAQTDPPAPSTVLVFHDQHRQEIQNYAIVGTMLWVFAPPRTQKISLADLDIPATTKANEDRGLDFGAPGGEAQ
jgi:hypothetical protein